MNLDFDAFQTRSLHSQPQLSCWEVGPFVPSRSRHATMLETRAHGSRGTWAQDHRLAWALCGWIRFHEMGGLVRWDWLLLCCGTGCAFMSGGPADAAQQVGVVTDD